MVLTCSHLEYCVKPICIYVVAFFEEILVGRSVVACGESRARIFGGCLDVLHKLVGLHHVVDVLINIVDAEVAGVIDFDGLVFLALLCGDDYHAVCCTRTVNCCCGCVLQNLDGCDVVG